MIGKPRTVAAVLATMLLHALPAGAFAAERSETFTPDAELAALDRSIDWSQAQLIAVQDGQRYKTLDSFAREMMHAMYGAEHFPGLSPLASMFEWLFNREEYDDVALVRIGHGWIHSPHTCRPNSAGFARPVT